MISSSDSICLTQDVRKTILDNGLTVLTKEVHTAPVVTAQVWYKIGSRDEAPGVNGIAHQLEHMLFQGTQKRPIQYGRLLAALGGDFNAFTSYDQTAYFNTIESDKLESILVLEADRMQNALIHPEQLEKEKQVVVSELQGSENSPYYRLNRAVMQAAFPDHPYGLMVGGTKADVESFTVEKVQSYYQKDYGPENAVLIIIGDFETASVLQNVQTIFGSVPQNNPEQTSRARQPIRQTFPPTSHHSGSIRLQEPGSIAIIQAVYPLPAVDHPDVPACNILDYILTNGRSSHLYQAVVEPGLASNIGGYTMNLSAGGWYEIYAATAAEEGLKPLQQAIETQITQLQTQPVTPQELRRAVTQIQADLVIENRDITNQAFILGEGETVAGDYQYIDWYLDAIAHVTPADVQRVANTYLKPEYRTLGFFVPTEIVTADQGANQNLRQTQESFQPHDPPDPNEVKQYLPQVETRSNGSQAEIALPEKFKLPNGMTVLLLADSSTPTLSLTGYLQAGEELDPDAKSGLASLVADNLMSGTNSQDTLALAQTLENRGINLSFSADPEGLNFAGVSLSQDATTLIRTLADVLQNATFPQDKLELTRQRHLTRLQARESNAGYVAYRALQQNIYPQNHPFHQFPSEQSLRSIDRQNVIAFYQNHYQPNTMTLVLVGDFQPEIIRSQITNLFGGWQVRGKSMPESLPEVSLPKSLVYINTQLPGIEESIIMMGHPGIIRRDPRFYAALVLNEILGGSTLSSRLGVELRDRLGLTYGVYSDFNAGLKSGAFTIQLQTSADKEQQAVITVLALLEQIHHRGVTMAEVEVARRGIVSSRQVQLADPDSLGDAILWNELNQLSQNELREFDQKIGAITLEAVNSAAQTLIHPDQIVVVTAGGKLEP
ncbi:MAG: insulinase family protein [Oscillatoriales cyanobacterium RM2_1_1]|nr:insulinase family protein [Oscillatoriales cyanobacterium RM2_1_1]